MPDLTEATRISSQTVLAADDPVSRVPSFITSVATVVATLGPQTRSGPGTEAGVGSAGIVIGPRHVDDSARHRKPRNTSQRCKLWCLHQCKDIEMGSLQIVTGREPMVVGRRSRARDCGSGLRAWSDSLQTSSGPEIRAGQIYRRRREMRCAERAFSEVVIAAVGDTSSDRTALSRPRRLRLIEFAGTTQSTLRS